MNAEDDRIAELFRTAASDAGAPPAAFDHDDVVRASRRATARRRSSLLGGLAVLGLVGVGAAVAVPGLVAEDPMTSAAAPMVAPEGARQDGAAPGAADSRAVPAVPGAPLGPGTTECADRQDPALRALVEQVLPEVAAATPAATTDVCLPGSRRGLSLEVDDGGATGLLTVTYLPPGTAVTAAEGVTATPTASGGTVLVGARGTGSGAPVPFEGRLGALAEHLAPRL